MENKTLKDLIERQIEKSTAFWAGSPKMTTKELEAAEKFAKEKSKLFEKAFDSPEKIKKVIELHTNSL